MTPHQEAALLGQIKYKPGYTFRLRQDPDGGRRFVQIEFSRKDAITGHWGTGRSGKVYLSPHMTQGEVVRKLFQCALALEEHEAREFFQWRGRAIFGPHIAAEALWEASETLDVRPPSPTE